jgi:protein-S-isoprenylcysteine O-methyltransferase Ste14
MTDVIVTEHITHGDVPATNPWRDGAAKAGVMLAFGMLTLISLAGIPRQLPIDNIHKVLTVAALIANVMFLSLIASTTLTRLAPIGKAKGIEPRVSALLGTFLCIGLSVLPKAELGPVLSALSSLLIMTGASLSFVALRWLGKSFSLSAEARRLVTNGPYRFVRHPLYVCEGVTVLGVLLQVISLQAVMVTLVFVAFQYRRMINEERILSSAFPEYLSYAERTPRIFPARVFGRIKKNTFGI